MEDRKKSILIHKRPIMFSPDLARLIGVNAAIILQHLEFLLTLPKAGEIIEDEKWIFNTLEEWHEDHFPFFSRGIIQDTFLRLQKSALVSVCQPRKGRDRTKYYRISEAGYEFLTTKNVPKSPAQDDHGVILPPHSQCGILPPCDGVILPPSRARASNQCTSSTSTTSTRRASLFGDFFSSEDQNKSSQQPKQKRLSKPISAVAERIARTRGVVAAWFGRRATTSWSPRENSLLARFTREANDQDMDILSWWFSQENHFERFKAGPKKNVSSFLSSWAAEAEKARRAKTHEEQETSETLRLPNIG